MSNAWSIDPIYTGGSNERGRWDRMITSVAERQHGVVARAQLLQAGVPDHVIDHRVALKRLNIVHLGVYAVGHRILTVDGRRMAAILAAGPGSALSHRAAGSIWQVLFSDYLEVTVPEIRRRPGIRVHRSQLPGHEITIVRGIPVTTIPRTLLDLARVLRPDQLERALNEAEVRRLTDLTTLTDLLERHARRPGVRAIRRVLATLESGGTVIRSELESQFLALVKRARLPRPEVNVPVQIAGRWFECDCLWRAQRVIVELDGRAVHTTALAFERDRARDRMLNAGGWRVIRITWLQVQREPEAVLLDLRRLLAAASVAQ